MVGAFSYQYVLLIAPVGWQWAFAPAALLYRETFARALLATAERAVGSCDTTVKMFVLNYSSSVHALFLAVCVGSTARNFTIYLLLLLDFLNNMYAGFKVVQLHHHSDETKRRTLASDDPERAVGIYFTNWILGWLPGCVYRSK